MKNVLKKIGVWLKGAFTKNLGMKVGALVFAFLLWSFVVADQNPVRDKIFNDVAITYEETDTLSERGLTSAVPFSEVLGNVTVTVEAKADNISYITKDMIQARVDLSVITEAGSYTLDITAASTSGLGQIVSVSPAEVTVEIENIETIDVPVEVEYEGEQQDWLYYGEPVLSESVIQVSGARSVVEQVARGICYVNIDGLTSSNKENRTVSLLDSDGIVLPSNQFTNVPTVIVELPIYPKKSISIDTAGIMESTTGLAEDYEIVGVTVEPAAIDLAGPLDIVNAVKKVSLETITLKDASTNQTIEKVQVLLPEGVYAASPSTVTVTIQISKQQETRVYEAADISVKNLGSGLRAELDPESVDVSVTGTTSALDAFTADQLEPFVDLQGLDIGVHEVEVKFQNTPDLDVLPTSTVQKIKVTISKR